MATFNVTGIDEAIQQLNLQAETIQRLGPAAAMAGGAAAAEALAATAPVRSGQLAGSMKVAGPYHTVADGYYCDVYPNGTRVDGERNATVGYVLEYGRSNMPARPWMRPALDSSAEAITAAMAEVLSEGGGA